jgi:hypothetical protein
MPRNNEIQTVQNNATDVSILEKARYLTSLQRTQNGAKPSYTDALKAVITALEIQSQPGISEENFIAAQRVAVNIVKNSAAMDVAANVDANLAAQLQGILNNQA